MTRLLHGTLSVIAGAALLACYAKPAPAEPTFYVAPDGKDQWSGRLPQANAEGTDGPFSTLGRARNAIRELKKEQDGRLLRPVSVLIRGGDYFLAEPLVLSPEDSGTAECPITYAAYEGETPRITGGQVVRGWKPAGGGAWTARLPEVKRGKWYFRQLFVAKQGQSCFHRRYRPNKGPFVIAGLTDSPVRRTSSRHTQSQQDFRFFPGDVRPWENLDDVEIVALHDWTASRLRIAELDLKRHVVRFTAYPIYRIGHWFKDGRNPYFAENVREAFDRPGQWYLDRRSGTLSYRPFAGERMDELTVVAPRTSELVKVTGELEKGAYVEHLVFRGLVLSHTHWALPAEGYSSRQGMIDLPAAVDLKAARHCRFERCTLSHLGGYAMRLGAGCHQNQVIGNRMFDLGGGGVQVGVTGRNDPPPVTPTGNRVANNVISDGGLVHYSAHGVWIGIAARTELSHNVIRRFLYSNVSVGWSWNDQPTQCRENVIRHNHIHDAMMLLADGGGIYTLGLQPGTTFRGNLIHAVHRGRFAGRAENNGIFFDQGSKEYLVEGNVIYDTANKLIRYNQSSPDWQTFRDNTLGIGPDDPKFPQAAAAKAGLQEEYRRLDAQPIEVTPTPILSMEIPEP